MCGKNYIPKRRQSRPYCVLRCSWMDDMWESDVDGRGDIDLGCVPGKGEGVGSVRQRYLPA